MSMLSRETCLKPSLETVILYLPTGRLRNTYVPFADVVAVCLPLMSAGLVTSRVAPGRATASSLSTVPVIFPS